MLLAVIDQRLAHLDGLRNDCPQVNLLATQRDATAAHARHIEKVFDQTSHVRGLAPKRIYCLPLNDGAR